MQSDGGAGSGDPGAFFSADALLAAAVAKGLPVTSLGLAHHGGPGVAGSLPLPGLSGSLPGEGGGHAPAPPISLFSQYVGAAGLGLPFPGAPPGPAMPGAGAPTAELGGPGRAPAGVGVPGTGEPGGGGGGGAGGGAGGTRPSSSKLSGSGVTGCSGDKGPGGYASRHQAAEQRRRLRINERLDTLRKIVPHTERANTASFLEEVIAYITKMQTRITQLETAAGVRASESFHANRASPSSADTMDVLSKFGLVQSRSGAAPSAGTSAGGAAPPPPSLPGAPVPPQHGLTQAQAQQLGLLSGAARGSHGVAGALDASLECLNLPAGWLRGGEVAGEPGPGAARLLAALGGHAGHHGLAPEGLGAEPGAAGPAPGASEEGTKPVKKRRLRNN